MGKFHFVSEPTCPFCRASFVDSDKMQILQMDEDEMYRYIIENTCFCPSCGCRVGNPGDPGYGEEECSWSDEAMCLCGFDFNLYEMKIDGMEPVRDRR